MAKTPQCQKEMCEVFYLVYEPVPNTLFSHCFRLKYLLRSSWFYPALFYYLIFILAGFSNLTCGLVAGLCFLSFELEKNLLNIGLKIFA